jgi:hypothetical protein
MFVDDFVRSFTANKRKSQASVDAAEINTPVLGAALARKHSDVIHQVMPQCSLFLCGTIYRDLINLQNIDPSKIPEVLEERGANLIQDHLMHIVDFAKGNKEKADRSWPVLLKSNTFFTHINAYLAGIRKQGDGHQPN